MSIQAILSLDLAKNPGINRKGKNRFLTFPLPPDLWSEDVLYTNVDVYNGDRYSMIRFDVHGQTQFHIYNSKKRSFIQLTRDDKNILNVKYTSMYIAFRTKGLANQLWWYIVDVRTWEILSITFDTGHISDCFSGIHVENGSMTVMLELNQHVLKKIL